MLGVLIAQITDTHVTRDGVQARYLGETIAHLNARQPHPAVVLLSGDTVNTGRPEQYEILRDLLAQSSAPVYAVPGNHDAREAFRSTVPRRHFPGVTSERLNYVIDGGVVRLIGLDTSEAGRPGGFLDDATLEWLDATLATAPSQPTLIFMHHPPFRTGVNAADLLGFRGLAHFRRIVASHPAVRRIIAGHIHCDRQGTVAQALATTVVSTAPQRVPELFERHIIGLRAEPPGFALHEWRADAFSSTTWLNVGAGGFRQRPSLG
jgi:3',5'-cyclic AMP phosphodiesterase CpdA